MVNLKPISNTLEMDFKRDFDLPILVHFYMFSPLTLGPNNHTEFMWQ